MFDFIKSYVNLKYFNYYIRRFHFERHIYYLYFPIQPHAMSRFRACQKYTYNIVLLLIYDYFIYLFTCKHVRHDCKKTKYNATLISFAK